MPNRFWLFLQKAGSLVEGNKGKRRWGRFDGSWQTSFQEISFLFLFLVLARKAYLEKKRAQTNRKSNRSKKIWCRSQQQSTFRTIEATWTTEANDDCTKRKWTKGRNEEQHSSYQKSFMQFEKRNFAGFMKTQQTTRETKKNSDQMLEEVSLTPQVPPTKLIVQCRDHWTAHKYPCSGDPEHLFLQI